MWSCQNVVHHRSNENCDLIQIEQRRTGGTRRQHRSSTVAAACLLNFISRSEDEAVNTFVVAMHLEGNTHVSIRAPVIRGPWNWSIITVAAWIGFDLTATVVLIARSGCGSARELTDDTTVPTQLPEHDKSLLKMNRTHKIAIVLLVGLLVLPAVANTLSRSIPFEAPIHRVWFVVAATMFIILATAVGLWWARKTGPSQ